MRKRLLSILLLCALLAGSASAAQLPAEHAASPDVLSAGERITGAGIDVSQYQGVIDWDTTAQYIDFAIIRCGRGSDLTEVGGQHRRMRAARHPVRCISVLSRTDRRGGAQ